MENKDFNEKEILKDGTASPMGSVDAVTTESKASKKLRKQRKKKNKKKMSKGKKALVIILSILGGLIFLVLILALAGYLYINSMLDEMPRTYDSDIVVVDPKDESFETDDEDSIAGEYSENKLPVVEPEDVEWETVSKFDDEDHINILLVGQDKTKKTGSRQRSDTMILCSINTETNKISLISFLRDLYVQIPGGYSDNRLNATYVFGGFPLLNQTLEKNFGVHIDYNFEVDFTGFENIIDYFGGINVDLTEAEANWLNTRVKWVFEDKPVKTGVNLLDGEQALHYARIRKLDSDFGRTSRQRNVLNIVFGKLNSLSLTELFEVAENILPYMTTDMTNSDIWSLIFEIGPEISDYKVSSYSVPATGDFSYARIRGMSVILPNLSKIRDRLENEYLPY